MSHLLLLLPNICNYAEFTFINPDILYKLFLLHKFIFVNTCKSMLQNFILCKALMQNILITQGIYILQLIEICIGCL